MDVFNALWNDPEQRRRPPDDNFQLFTMGEWLATSSTHKILTGSLQCPLPPEIEPSGKGSKNTHNCNIKDLLIQKAKRDEASQRAPPKHLAEGKVYVPGLTKFPEFNRVSALTSHEQADCLKLWLKFDGKSLEELSPSEKTEYQLFQSLYLRVKEEQKVYLELAREHWPEDKPRTITLKGDPHNFFLQYWETNVSYAMSQYPHKYKRLRKFSLHENGEIKQNLHFIKNVLNVGKIPIIRLPEFHAPFRIASSILKLRAWDYLHVPASQLNGTLHKVPVSRDPNAERLARLHNAKFVISTGGIRCLLDNHDEKKYPPVSGVGKSWVLPIVVKEHRSFCGGKPVTKTIIFIDKPLPKPKLTGLEKVSFYQKKALFAAVVNRNHPGGIEFDIKGEDILIRKSTTCSENSSGTSAEESVVKSNSMDEKSTVENEKLPSNNISAAVHIENNNASEDEDEVEVEDEDALTIDLPDYEVISSKQLAPSSKATESDRSKIEEQSKSSDSSDQATTNSAVIKSDLGIKDQTAQSSMGVDTTSSTATAEKRVDDSDNQAQPNDGPNKWEKLPPPESVKIVNGNALPVSSTNFTYNLWCLKPEYEENDQNQSSDINLLIRSRVDGCELGENAKPICLATKPEYQLEYGASILPLSDLTRQWAKLLIQPDTALARIRVNVQKCELVKLEKRSLLEVEEETEALYKTSLPDTLLYLRKALAELNELPVGQYLLSHSPHMGSTVELFSTSNESDAVDWHLSKDYGNRPEVIEIDVPWPKIDTNVVLPKHLQMQCMPCTFHSPKGPVLQSKPSKPPKKETNVVKANMNKKKKKKKNKSNKPQNKSGGQVSQEPQ